jgi:hypothetical protein
VPQPGKQAICSAIFVISEITMKLIFMESAGWGSYLSDASKWLCCGRRCANCYLRIFKAEVMKQIVRTVHPYLTDIASMQTIKPHTRKWSLFDTSSGTKHQFEVSHAAEKIGKCTTC